MKEFASLITQWGGLIILLVLCVIGIVSSLIGSTSRDERQLAGSDDSHYVLRQPLGRVVKPLIFLAAGIVIIVVINLLQRFTLQQPAWLAPVIKTAAGIVCGLLFWTELAKVVRHRIFVNGDKIIVTPAFGAPIETTFSQIRTVANKVAGHDGGVVGKKIKTKEGNRFEAINSMSDYDRFCRQLDEKVELPDLTKKLFKGKKKKEQQAEESWTNETGTVPEPVGQPFEGTAVSAEAGPDTVASDIQYDGAAAADASAGDEDAGSVAESAGSDRPSDRAADGAPVHQDNVPVPPGEDMLTDTSKGTED